MLLLVQYENYKNGNTSFLICLLKKGYGVYIWFTECELKILILISSLLVTQLIYVYYYSFGKSALFNFYLLVH